MVGYVFSQPERCEGGLQGNSHRWRGISQLVLRSGRPLPIVAAFKATRYLAMQGTLASRSALNNVAEVSCSEEVKSRYPSISVEACTIRECVVLRCAARPCTLHNWLRQASEIRDSHFSSQQPAAKAETGFPDSDDVMSDPWSKVR